MAKFEYKNNNNASKKSTDDSFLENEEMIYTANKTSLFNMYAFTYEDSY